MDGSQIFLHGGTALGWAGTLLVVGLLWVIRTFVRAGKVRELLERVLGAVKRAVMGVYQGYVADLKAAAADGTLTNAEKDEAKKRAVAAAKRLLGEGALDLVKSLLGIGDIDAWLGDHVEAALHEGKVTGVIPAATANGVGRAAPRPLT